MFWRNLIVTSLYLIAGSLYAEAQIVRSVYKELPREPEANTHIYYGVENILRLSPEYNKKNVGVKVNKGKIKEGDKGTAQSWGGKVFLYTADAAGAATFYVFDSIKNTILDSCNLKIKPLPNPRVLISITKKHLGNVGEIAGLIIAILDTPQIAEGRVRTISSELKCKDVYIKTVNKFDDDVLSFLKNIKNGDTVYCKNTIVKVANDTTLRRIRLNEIVCYKANGILYYTNRGLTFDRLPPEFQW